MQQGLNTRVRAANEAYLPFFAFVALAVVGGLLCGLVIFPWLAQLMWELAEPWGWDGYGWFFGAGVCTVVLLFGLANIFLRMIGCDALEVKLPPNLAAVRRAGPRALAWWGIVPIVIGMVIGKTIFT
jgi:hypothetical protein